MLSDAEIRKAKPKATAQKLSDGHGLFLLLTPDGRKYWRWSYRYQRKQKTLSFGVYPTVPLTTARAKRLEARRQLDAGHDPSVLRRRAKAMTRGATFAELAAELVARRQATLRPKTLKRLRWVLHQCLVPKLGTMPVSQITALDVVAALKPLERRGKLHTAHRAKQICGQVLRFAVATGRLTHNPIGDLVDALPAAEAGHYAAITDPAQIGALLRAIDGYDGHPLVRCALQLAPLLFVRPGELRQMEWSEITGDLWTIPAAKMKSRADHLVPLSRQAREMLARAKWLQGEKPSRYVFHSLRTRHRPLSEGTLGAALRRLGYGHDEMVPHGFRALASTRLNELKAAWGLDRDWIEAQLAHTDSTVRGIYNRARYLPERTRMMQQWADQLDRDRQMAARQTA